ncbi:hypothetical protein [Candidatus Methanoperedens nitratireducens]|nr:hypothetical protein [Candidatus Methanoperedens nitroreducens]
MSAKINKNVKFLLELEFAGHCIAIINSRNPRGNFSSIIKKQVHSL